MNFEDRVKLLFGSKLFESVPKSSFPSSSWSVTDGAVERREWNRERGFGQRDREDDPCSSAFYDKHGCLFKNKKCQRDKERDFEGDFLDDDVDDDEERDFEGDFLDDDVDDDEERDDEEAEIRASVGLDPTLDNEDEEDEYDKAALCRENAGERVYMRDVNDHGPYMNYHAVVPDSIDEPSNEALHFHRDPRADHCAAHERLREDKSAEPFKESSIKVTENDANRKPILKRKEPQIDAKPKKRVRFDTEYKDDDHAEVSEEPQNLPSVPQSIETVEISEACISIPEESPNVPDYLKNPSKYTRYTFDSSDRSDEETNRRAFEDFRNLVRRSEPEFSMEIPKSVTFTPRKKSVDVLLMDNSPVNHKSHGQILGRSVANISEACEMDEDGAETPAVDTSMITQKGRTYRSRSISDDGI